MVDLFGSIRRETLVKAGAATLCVAAVALAVGTYFGTRHDPTPQGGTQLTCDACGHVWSADWDERPECPECGAAGGIVRAKYRCPSCGHVFEGTEMKHLGPGEQLWRAIGQEEWSNIPVRQLTCPACEKPFVDIDKVMVTEGPGGGGG